MQTTPPAALTETNRTWTMIHENDSRIAARPMDLKFAFECGYRWVNKGDGNGWMQISWAMKRIGR